MPSTLRSSARARTSSSTAHWNWRATAAARSSANVLSALSRSPIHRRIDTAARCTCDVASIAPKHEAEKRADRDRTLEPVQRDRSYAEDGQTHEPWHQGAHALAERAGRNRVSFVSHMGTLSC